MKKEFFDSIKVLIIFFVFFFVLKLVIDYLSFNKIVEGLCSAPDGQDQTGAHPDQSTCESAGSCSDGSITIQTACEDANETWTPYTWETDPAGDCTLAPTTEGYKYTIDDAQPNTPIDLSCDIDNGWRRATSDIPPSATCDSGNFTFTGCIKDPDYVDPNSTIDNGCDFTAGDPSSCDTASCTYIPPKPETAARCAANPPRGDATPEAKDVAESTCAAGLESRSAESERDSCSDLEWAGGGSSGDCRWLEAQSAQPESCIPSDISAAAKEAAKLAEQVADTARAAGNEEAAEKAQEAGATLDSNDPNLDGVVDVLETVKESAEELSDNDELVTKVDELIQSNKALQDKINKDKGFFDKHGNMIIIGLIIFVGLAILGGLFMMSKSMKPVREIIVEAGRRATETVEEVTDGPLISEP